MGQNLATGGAPLAMTLDSFVAELGQNFQYEKGHAIFMFINKRAIIKSDLLIKRAQPGQIQSLPEDDSRTTPKRRPGRREIICEAARSAADCAETIRAAAERYPRRSSIAPLMLIAQTHAAELRERTDQDGSNVLPYQQLIETDKAVYLVRQFVSTNLYDRIRYAGRHGHSTRYASTRSF